MNKGNYWVPPTIKGLEGAILARGDKLWVVHYGNRTVRWHRTKQKHITRLAQFRGIREEQFKESVYAGT